jgi:hypothetical protein
LAGVYLYWIQENEASKSKDKSIFKKFDRAAEKALELAGQQEAEYPHSGYPWVYKGATVGSQGMVNLYQKHYWTSYRQGLTAAQHLRKAVEIDPSNNDVYFGLGQFEYYCGRLAGVLRFFLRLKGDEEAGIKMMERSAAKGTYARLPAKSFLSHVFIRDRKEFKRGQPYVDELFGRFPESYYHFENAILLSLGLGLEGDRSKRRMEAVCEQWDKGWRPPEHVQVSVDPARMALARQYISEKKPARALAHLSALTLSEDKSLARRAQEMLDEISQVKP